MNPYLRSHATPEVGVGGSGLHHGRYNSLVLAHQLPQHIWIGEQIVTVGHLQTEEKDTILTTITHNTPPFCRYMIDCAMATWFDHGAL